jgi:phosphoglycolate phosphatase
MIKRFHDSNQTVNAPGVTGQFQGPVEFAHPPATRTKIRHIVFDFDGTLSWLRHGWPRIMCGLFRSVFPVRADESEEEVCEVLLGDILELSGKPTIFQVMRFCQSAADRGNPGLDPDLLLQEYQKRLLDEVDKRSRLIQEGGISPDEFVVYGARPFLCYLREKGLGMSIVSATSEPSVVREAALLNIDSFFGPRIYGSGADGRHFSKRDVISRILDAEKMDGDNLLSFGDGPVEIEFCKELGGLGIGVASEEERNGSGVMDPEKRLRLLEAGADVIIPDFRDAIPLIENIVGSGKLDFLPPGKSPSSTRIKENI